MTRMWQYNRDAQKKKAFLGFSFYGLGFTLSMYSSDPQKKAFQNTSSMNVWSVGECQAIFFFKKGNKQKRARTKVYVCLCV